MRLALIMVLLAVLAAGCGSNGDDAPGAAGENRVERCVERLVERAEGVDRADAERYVRRAYCQPFARRGWVHEDGTLKIAVVGSGTSMCAAPQPGEPVQTVPCHDIPGPLLDCGLLDLVRRAEAQAYIKERQGEGDVRCDDGRPLDELGS